MSRAAAAFGTAPAHTSRFATLSALSWMNSRRGSTMSPISLTKMSSASSTSRIFTCRSGAGLAVEGRLPELVLVHLAKALVALEGHALAAGGVDRLEQLRRTGHGRRVAAAREGRGLGEGFAAAAARARRDGARRPKRAGPRRGSRPAGRRAPRASARSRRLRPGRSSRARSPRRWRSSVRRCRRARGSASGSSGSARGLSAPASAACSTRLRL